MASTFMISIDNFHTYAVIFACTHIFTMNLFKANLIHRATTTSSVSSICTIQLLSIWSMELHLQKISLTIAVSDLVSAVYASTVEIDGRRRPIHLCAVVKLNGVKTLFRDLVNLRPDTLIAGSFAISPIIQMYAKRVEIAHRSGCNHSS